MKKRFNQKQAILIAIEELNFVSDINTNGKIDMFIRGFKNRLFQVFNHTKAVYKWLETFYSETIYSLKEAKKIGIKKSDRNSLLYCFKQDYLFAKKTGLLNKPIFIPS